ncbi:MULTISPECIES: winged helix-turn-helix domain-containing protein [unclassified Variovorax]|uniref:winged helix-turn-helix domain-containing protein n=1 Tax=unclassified Variovorax TaxID=663243 RepID=UPI003ECE24DA
MSNVRMWPVESADALSPLQRRHAPAGTSSEDLIHFGPFSLSPTTHILQDAGRPVRLGSRALEILLLLVENAGRFVSNAKIVQRVWPRNVVVDGNLRVHIAGLRKALGDGQEGRDAAEFTQDRSVGSVLKTSYPQRAIVVAHLSEVAAVLLTKHLHAIAAGAARRVMRRSSSPP